VLQKRIRNDMQLSNASTYWKIVFICAKKAGLPEQIIVSCIFGFTRFVYRLIPGPLRYVPEYSQAVRRSGESLWCWLFDPIARGMEAYMRWAKDFTIGILLPAPQARGQPHQVGNDAVVAGVAV